MKVDKKIFIAVGVLATIGVTGLAFMYRKQISQFLTGTNLMRIRATTKANEEFNKWNKSGETIKEHDQRTVDRLKEYWQASGKTYESMKGAHWSAAFISYLMKSAGAGDNFKYATSHSSYIQAAIQNTLKNEGRFKGYKPEDIYVEVGDLVCYPRSNSGADFTTQGGYESHCDICVKVDKKKNEAITIGGNVSDSVSKTTVRLTNEGKIDLTKTNKDYFVVIKY